MTWHLEHTHPLHRIVSLTGLLTPVSIERFTYAIPRGTAEFSFLYIFGVRVARWNSS